MAEPRGRHREWRMMPELRHDPLTDRLVIVAPERAGRPQTASWALEDAPVSATDCPFCPGNESLTPPEVGRTGTGPPETPGWRVRIVPNKYPMVGDGGAHEVVVLSPAHDRSLGRLDLPQAVEAMTTLRDRAAHHLEAGHAFVQVLVNHGAAAGASLPHPHAQLVALDLVPPAVIRTIARLDDVGRDLVADAIAEAGGLAVTSGSATVWCPYAAGAPFTFRVAHGSTRAQFVDATDAELRAVTEATQDALARLVAVLGDVPYNLVVHTAPPGHSGPFHWYVEVTPRIATVAGFEMGTGILVNTVAPEQAAEMLRAAT